MAVGFDFLCPKTHIWHDLWGTIWRLLKTLLSHMLALAMALDGNGDGDGFGDGTNANSYSGSKRKTIKMYIRSRPLPWLLDTPINSQESNQIYKPYKGD